MEVLIVDNNKEFANQMCKDLFNHFSQITDRISFDLITEDFENIKLKLKYDIVFLDIKLLEENGIEIAKNIKQKGICNMIVFVSAHAHLVYDSFIVRPFFFLRKSNYQNDLKVFYDLVDDTLTESNLIALKYSGESKMISVNDIIFIESIDHELKIHTKDSVYYDSRTLKSFTEIINSNNFVQIYKSYVINLDFMLSYTTTSVILVENITLPIGRVYKENFIVKLQEYLIK